MLPSSSQSSPPQQQQPESSSALQISTLPQAGTQQLQVTRTPPLLVPTYTCLVAYTDILPHHIKVYISCFICLCLFLMFPFLFSGHTSVITMAASFCSSTLPFCMLLIPTWFLVLGQWSESSYPVTSTQRRAPILPLSGLMPLCSAGTLQSTRVVLMFVGQLWSIWLVPVS